jgi:DNA-binding transcriptional ArsR family regulator
MRRGPILNPVVKYSEDQLDDIFAALSDRTRRKVLASLDQGSRPVTELAAAHDMSLPGFMKHLRVLEEAGLLERTKEGRVVRCTLQPEPMKEAASWIAQYEKFWTDKLDSLARYLYQQEEFQTWNKPVSQKSPRSASAGDTRYPRRRSGGRGPTRKR